MNGKNSDYSRVEIGMLAGTACGGVLALVGYLATNRIAFLLVSVLGAFLGIAAGKLLESKKPVTLKAIVEKKKKQP